MAPTPWAASFSHAHDYTKYIRLNLVAMAFFWTDLDRCTCKQKNTNGRIDTNHTTSSCRLTRCNKLDLNLAKSDLK